MKTLDLEQMEDIKGGWELCVAGTIGIIAGTAAIIATGGGAAPLAVLAYSTAVNSVCYYRAA